MEGGVREVFGGRVGHREGEGRSGGFEAVSHSRQAQRYVQGMLYDVARMDAALSVHLLQVCWSSRSESPSRASVRMQCRALRALF